MPYQYHGADPETPNAPTKPATGNERLAAAAREHATHTRRQVAAVSPTGVQMTPHTALQLQALAKALPMGLTREQLLTISGYNSTDTLRMACNAHGLRHLYTAYMRRPFKRRPRNRTFDTAGTHRITQGTRDRFNMIEALLTYGQAMTREELLRRVDWELDYFAKATRRHDRRDLWDRAAALPKQDGRGRPASYPGGAGPHRTTTERFEDTDYILRTDPGAPIEEVLHRAGWPSYVAFERACFRHKQRNTLDMARRRLGRAA